MQKIDKFSSLDNTYSGSVSFFKAPRRTILPGELQKSTKAACGGVL